VGCRGRTAQAELVRFALRDGQVVPDPDRRAPGRGAWLHADAECLELALQRGGFSRAFRKPVSVPEKTVDWMRNG
jgi:predicted RNA-binding protein YlxR (DUF448 family)